jgi:uroporphyrinogen decarboxylase
MAYRAGPLVSPRTFDEFFVPCYMAVMDEARKHGCTLSCVDCDGNIHDLVPGWLKTGVNIMFPCEVAAGTDMFRMRREFGREVRLQGGIDKKAVAAGRKAIDRELGRIAPLLEQGGFIPHLDHLVPPDISFADYQYYREQKKKLIGKT